MALRFKRLTLGTLAWAFSLGLGGCLDLNEKITLTSDNKIILETDLQFDPEFKDIAKLFEVVGRAGPEAAKFQDGLCVAPQKFMEADPQPNITMTSQQFEADGKFICQAEVTLANVNEFVALAARELPSDSPLKIQEIGERRVSIALNLNELQKFTNETEALLVTSIRSLAFTDPVVTDAEILTAYRLASLASTRITYKDRHLTLVFKAPQVIESVGHTSRSETEVVFRWTWVELQEMTSIPERHKDKTFSVVLQY